ncbi:hypothetical protein D3C74_355190 [compost metagenome]
MGKIAFSYSVYGAGELSQRAYQAADEQVCCKDRHDQNRYTDNKGLDNDILCPFLNQGTVEIDSHECNDRFGRIVILINGAVTGFE